VHIVTCLKLLASYNWSNAKDANDAFEVEKFQSRLVLQIKIVWNKSQTCFSVSLFFLHVSLSTNSLT